MPRQIEIVEFRSLDLFGVDAELAQHRFEILTVQYIELRERTLATADPLHRGLILRAPRIRECVGFLRVSSMTLQKCSRFTRDAASPIDERAEYIEYAGLYVGCCHVEIQLQ
ncbi:hypothetical protein PTKU46_75460 [Paraburkholderia terrae]